ncbi:hypothetical protein EYF80_028028 [Liparis tanakae]|uniref:Uncharacterized protein n=1 Tax=Liparis tanakae TaxID=230148 RepID=A0A4Z2H7R0_9TELE|nr:hypothetical protein EYF80_028028 [Liparis tanakae]
MRRQHQGQAGALRRSPLRFRLRPILQLHGRLLHRPPGPLGLQQRTHFYFFVCVKKTLEESRVQIGENVFLPPPLLLPPIGSRDRDNVFSGHIQPGANHWGQHARHGVDRSSMVPASGVILPETRSVSQPSTGTLRPDPMGSGYSIPSRAGTHTSEPKRGISPAGVKRARESPSILLELCSPVQQDPQPGLQLQLAVQAPPPGLLELFGCSYQMMAWTRSLV